MRTILHADMDAFFAAVEAREDPSIAGRPIVVGADPKRGTGRGVVAACNYAARRYGIHSAMPISQAYRRCPDAVYLPVRMRLYARVSERVMEIFEGFTDRIEKLSIDEAFLDVSGSTRIHGDGAAIARELKERVRDRESLTVSVGVASNKFLAKLASDLEKPDGLVVVEPGRENAFLRPLPIVRLWGVGARTAERLESLGIRTVGDLADSPVELLQKRLGGLQGTRLHRLAHGIDDRPVEPDRQRKQIGRETTFSTDEWDRVEVERTLLALTEQVAARLRARGVAGRTVTLKLRLAPFDTVTRQRTLEVAGSTTEALFPVARELLVDADAGDRPVRLVGLSVSGLQTAGEQLTLFGERSDARVADVVDTIARRFGDRAMRRAKTMASKRRPRKRSGDARRRDR